MSLRVLLCNEQTKQLSFRNLRKNISSISPEMYDLLNMEWIRESHENVVAVDRWSPLAGKIYSKNDAKESVRESRWSPLP